MRRCLAMAISSSTAQRGGSFRTVASGRSVWEAVMRAREEEAGGGGPGAAPAGGTALRSQREALVAVEAEGELPEGQMDAGGHRVVALEHVSMHLRAG